MHLEPVTQSEVSQKKKKSVYSCINMEYRKWYLWTYLQGRNRDTDVENGYVDAAREGEGGMNWEWHWQIQSTMYTTDSKCKIVYNMGSSAWCCVTA